jgi:hypothetical protein
MSIADTSCTAGRFVKDDVTGMRVSAKAKSHIVLLQSRREPQSDVFSVEDNIIHEVVCGSFGRGMSILQDMLWTSLSGGLDGSKGIGTSRVQDAKNIRDIIIAKSRMASSYSARIESLLGGFLSCKFGHGAELPLSISCGTVCLIKRLGADLRYDWALPNVVFRVVGSVGSKEVEIEISKSIYRQALDSVAMLQAVRR